jgi:16S rRNA (cytosine1402-N4)-methyltransferase
MLHAAPRIFIEDDALHQSGVRLAGSWNFSGRRPLGGTRRARSMQMTAAGDGFAAVAGGSARHIPVLGAPALDFLNVRDGGIYIDATFGAGGYARAILGKADCKVIGIDRDPSAIASGEPLVQAARGRLTLIEERFSRLDAVARDAGVEAVDGVVLDLGVSSMQLDTAARGFSFRLDGPLDMRMGGDGPSAADVVARASERDLANIIFLLGEERHSRAVARAVVKTRAEAPIRTTAALADIVASVVRSRPGDIHPATRTFQALRIFVNDELGELVAALHAAERILKPQGRLVVVSFHSLEDRIVKSFLSGRGEARAGSRHAPERQAPAATFRVLTKRPIIADQDEVARNPRARSAKLRAAEREPAPARDDDMPGLLPQLPALADVVKGR